MTECDVRSDDDVARVFSEVADAFGGGLDLLVHSVAFAAAEDLEGRFTDTPRDRFWLAVDISAYSLVACARAAEPLMEARGGGSIVTMTYLGGERAVPHYNVMGVAKSALDASVRYLAWDLGAKNIRVNAISAGPVRTLAARSIAGFTTMEEMFERARAAPPPDRRGRLRRGCRVPPLGRGAERHRHDALRRCRLPRDGHVEAPIEQAVFGSSASCSRRRVAPGAVGEFLEKSLVEADGMAATDVEQGRRRGHSWQR